MELRLQASPEKVLILEVSSLRRVKPGTVPHPQCPASIWRRGQSHGGLRARGAGGTKGSLDVVYNLLGGDATCLL